MNVVATVGASALLTALGASLFAAGASIVGHRLGHRALLLAGRRAIHAVALLTTTAVATLGYALLADDFSIAHVASVSSSEMQTTMKWASLYSGQPGSLLFWTWSMSLFMAAFVLITAPRIPWGAPHAVATLGMVIAAFLVALVFFASPFRVSPVTPADGQGLNPLLVDPGMLVHPPFLLSGLVSTVVPFALGAAALLSGRLDGAWVRHARGWALTSFLVLSVGNFLGGWWAYTVLGWGGYWGWDPVENSAILPLLPIIGFLHALIVQERRGMLKTWNVVLVLAAFCLAVFGTFNVRSGLVASVHSFAQSEVGPYFLVLLGVTVATSLALIVWRLPRLRAVSELDSLASRETGLILNSYLMIAMALVILGGTLFPVFSELLRDARITVGPPFFNEVMGPLFRAGLLTALAFAAISVLTYSFVFDLTTTDVRPLLPGVLWTTFLFAGVFAAGTGFQREAEEGTFDALLLSPVSPTVVFLGKLVSNLIALVVIEFALLIAATILFDEPLLTPELVAIVMLGTVGYASLTTLRGTLGSGPRTRAVLLPVMALPLLVPMLIAAVRATGDTLGLFGGDAPWILLLGVFALWSTLTAVILFPLAVER